MCLYTFQDTQRTAQQDITVYKVVIIRNGNTYTPYLETPIPTETLNGHTAFKAQGNTNKIRDWRNQFAIEGGNIHTYAIASYAWENALIAQQCEQAAVYECVIPKGTKYYSGWTYGHRASYASKQIRFVKKLIPPQKYIAPELELC